MVFVKDKFERADPTLQNADRRQQILNIRVAEEK